ncbi:hypothetical protein [Sphingobium estronivorans]|uniref:hypothetical protein n=1 Tax=Sphingobium estronivorans TaxID=1577690 RepID=UPI001966D4D9|nr:hypothetical protein [Sphingobium estronivorans]
MIVDDGIYFGPRIMHHPIGLLSGGGIPAPDPIPAHPPIVADRERKSGWGI